MTATAAGRGALRHIGPEEVVGAAGLVREGLVVPLNLPITTHTPSRPAPVHRMLEHHSLRRMGSGGYGVVNDDALDIALQGSTHWDALGHFGVLSPGSDGVYHGGATLAETARPGLARSLGVEHLARGIVGRGVLLDLVVTLAPGERWVPGERRIGADDIRACLALHGIALARGDIVCLYTGFEDLLDSTSAVFPKAIAGIDGSTVPLWIDAEVAGLTSDNLGVEAVPADFEVHARLLCDAGVPLGELWALREAAATAARLGRWEFLLVSVPLNVPGAYGSPANAVAVF